MSDEVRLEPCPELVERVARALKPNLFKLYPSGNSAAHQSARNMARAAIEATRPTIVTGQLEPQGERVSAPFPLQSHPMGCCSAAIAGLLGLPLMERLEATEFDANSARAPYQRLVNPDGPEATALIRELVGFVGVIANARVDAITGSIVLGNIGAPTAVETAKRLLAKLQPGGSNAHSE